MPQSAATMLGLILVAASIGFNMTHWPAVGRTVAQVEAPTRPDEAVDAAPEPEAGNTTPSPDLPVPATVVPEAASNDLQPARDMREEPVYASLPVAEEAPAVVRERPLVPIPPLRNPSMPMVMDISDHSVRRLPPVDDPRPAYLPGNDATVSNTIPIYPSTGVE